jgi:hypothetical protein
MLEFLKDNTIGRIKLWYTRQMMRVMGDLHMERLRERAKDVPEELKEYHSREMIMTNNATALHNLYKKSKDGKKFQEAFLYFFYEFEINLKHMIMSEMLFRNHLRMLEDIEALRKNTVNHFLVYPKEEINKIQKIGKIATLIELFCFVHGDEIQDSLTGINQARNYIIHNMLKEEMSEGAIEKSFEFFFTASSSAINDAYRYFNKTMEERPERMVKLIKELSIKNGIKI